MSDNIGDLEVQIQASFRGLAESIDRKIREIQATHSITLRTKIQASALSGLKKQLMGLPGAIFGATSSFMRFGGMATLAAGALGPLSTGVGGLAVLLGTLGTAALGGLGAMPGLFAAAGASLFVFKTAFDKANLQKYFGDLSSQFSSLKDIIGKNFWSAAAAPVHDFLATSFPAIKSGFADLSKAAGGFLGHLAEGFKKAFTPGVIHTFFSQVSSFWDILGQKAAGPLADIAQKLVSFGGTILPMIANALSNVITKFDTFLKKNPTFLADNFKIFVGVLKAVGGALMGIIQLIHGIATAAQAAGIGALGLGGGLAHIGSIVNGPAFQKGLTGFFRDALSGARGLGQALAPLGTLLAHLAPILGGFIAGAGKGLGVIFKGIFQALDQPVVLNNLRTVFTALPKIFMNLVPALKPFLALVSSVLAALAPIADELTKSIAVLVRGLAPILQTLLPPLDAIARALGPVLREALKLVMPYVAQIGKALKPLLLAVADFVKELNNPVIKFVLKLILGFVVVAVKGFANLATGVLKIVTGLLEILHGNFKEGFSKIFDGFKKAVVGAFELFITFFAPAKIAGVIGRLFPALARVGGPAILKFVVMILKGLEKLPFLGSKLMGKFGEAVLKDIPKLGEDIIKGLMKGIEALVGAFVSFFFNVIVGGIKKILGISSPSTVFMEIGKMLIQGLIDGIKALIGLVADLFSAPIEAIKTAFTAAFDVILAGGKLLWEGLKLYFKAWKTIITTEIRVVREVVKGVWTAIKTAGKAVWDAIEKHFKAWKIVITTGIRAVRDVVKAVWDAIKTAALAVWDRIKESFRTMKDILLTAVRAMKDVFVGVWHGIRDAATGVWTRIKEAWANVKEHLASSVRALKSVFTGVWDAVKSTFIGAINGLIGAWNGFVSHLKIPKISIPFAPDFPGVDIGSHLKIPYLAKGIRDFWGGLAIVGEKGPELVSLPKGSDVFSNEDSRSMLRGDGRSGDGRPPIELKVVNYYPQAEPTSVTTNKTLQRAALLGVV